MRLAFLGTPDFAVPTLAALLDAGHEIAAVYTQPPRPSGRGQAVRPTPVETFAQARGLIVRQPASMRELEAAQAFAALALDAAVVVAYGQILPRAVLEAPRLGMFNLHASLLPRWRGAAPIQRAIMAGDGETGVQVMRMTEGLDEGPILGVAREPILADDTAASLAARLSRLGAELMPGVLTALADGSATQVAQVGEPVYARKITAAEARIDWTRPAAEVDRRIRGLSPAPGAWFEAQSPRGPVRVKVQLSAPAPGGASEVPGTIIQGPGLVVACADGGVRLLRVQREGRGVQDAEDYLRGASLSPGARFG